MMSEIKSHPLAWPVGWPRTSVKDQKSNQQWKKALDWYRREVVDELKKLKAPRWIISTNAPVANGVLSELGAKAARDMGVAVYFERPIVDDFKWMNTLMLTGVPTDEDIDTAWKRLAPRILNQGRRERAMMPCPVCAAPLDDCPIAPVGGGLLLCQACRCWLIWDSVDVVLAAPPGQLRALTNQ